MLGGWWEVGLTLALALAQAEVFLTLSSFKMHTDQHLISQHDPYCSVNLLEQVIYEGSCDLMVGMWVFSSLWPSDGCWAGIRQCLCALLDGESVMWINALSLLQHWCLGKTVIRLMISTMICTIVVKDCHGFCMKLERTTVIYVKSITSIWGSPKKLGALLVQLWC